MIPKRKHNRRLRDLKKSDDEDDEEDEEETGTKEAIETTKLKQKIRKSKFAIGANTISLEDIGMHVSQSKSFKFAELTKNDVQSQSSNSSRSKDYTDINNSFSHGTIHKPDGSAPEENIDVEPDNVDVEDTQINDAGFNAVKEEQEYLFDVPENLKIKNLSQKHVDDMVPSQMLTSIPEIKLGVEHKIKTMEEIRHAITTAKPNARPRTPQTTLYPKTSAVSDSTTNAPHYHIFKTSETSCDPSKEEVASYFARKKLFERDSQK